MALPYRGDEDFGAQHRGSYSPAEDGDPVKKTETAKAFASFQSSNMSKREGFMGRVRRLQENLSQSCCSCIEDIPTLAFLIGLIFLIFILLAVISLLVAWALASSGTTLGFKASPVGENMDRKLEGYIRDNNFSRDAILFSGKKIFPPNISKCVGYGFSCTNAPGFVVGTLQRCDGVKDCPDGSDEENCQVCNTGFNCTQTKPGEAASSFFYCLRGIKLCDGVQDCPDGSDENLYCKNRECSKDEWKCDYIDKCIPKKFRCDGDPQCMNHSDEDHCTENDCTGGAVWCDPEKRCIPKWQLCDGIKQCVNGIDEKKCSCRECCGSLKALCQDSNVCISAEHVCDKRHDCPNGSDEIGCKPGFKSGIWST